MIYKKYNGRQFYGRTGNAVRNRLERQGCTI